MKETFNKKTARGDSAVGELIQLILKILNAVILKILNALKIPHRADHATERELLRATCQWPRYCRLSDAKFTRFTVYPAKGNQWPHINTFASPTDVLG